MMPPLPPAYKSRAVTVGGRGRVQKVTIGGANPVVVQTMWKDKIDRAAVAGKSGELLLQKIAALSDMGARLIRFAVPDGEAANILGEIAAAVTVPLVADIHFDYKLALRVLDFPVAKLRVNPGNIGSKERVFAILEKAGKNGVPVRIGVNGGSLPAGLRAKLAAGEISRTEALVEAALSELAVFDEVGFTEVVVSLKASSVKETIEANRLMAARRDVPLHIGVTEAGPLCSGLVRSTAALYTLLGEGIGDTVRVSLSDTAANEVIAGREIIRTVYETCPNAENRCNDGPFVRLVSCPRCGRCGFDTHAFTEKWQPYLYTVQKPITVAVMGCVVNGPEEARHADLGITGAGDKVIIFKGGSRVRTVNRDEADEAFKQELDSL